MENDLELHLRDFDSQSICPSGENAAAAAVAAAAPRALFPHKKSFVLIFCHSKQASLPLSHCARAFSCSPSIRSFALFGRSCIFWLVHKSIITSVSDTNMCKAWMLSWYTSIFHFLDIKPKALGPISHSSGPRSKMRPSPWGPLVIGSRHGVHALFAMPYLTGEKMLLFSPTHASWIACQVEYIPSYKI